MNFRLTVLTPTLTGDGNSLSPIDYMVWKDQVNVLDQTRIFRLLSKGSRLDGYLNQVKKADKLDFASWGGFAQNYAARRIPFEHATSSAHWQRLRADLCHIPTFARNHTGPYLPASALRGALRTAMVSTRLDAKAMSQVAQQAAEKGAWRVGEWAEQRALSPGSSRTGLDPLKTLALSDSRTTAASFYVYLIRTATLSEPRSPQGSAKGLSLAWKLSPSGSVEPRRVDDSTPAFAEMAAPGSVFEGSWSERGFYQSEATVQALHWRHPFRREQLCRAANDYALVALAAHRQFARLTGLAKLDHNLEALETRLGALDPGSSCLLSLGWGAGLFGKTAFPNPGDESYRGLLSSLPFYARAIRTGMPFPKTRRVVFLGGEPAALPGWVLLEIK